jgi:hypothetical protein
MPNDKPEDLPETHEVMVSLVPKPDEVVIWWLDEIEAFIHTTAYSR